MTEGGVLRIAKERTMDLIVPDVKPTLLLFLLGLLNCFAFGLGVLLAGIYNRDWADVLIGVMQALIPVVGWCWAVLWGVMMMLKCLV